MSVITFPPISADEAWTRYHDLIHQCFDNPALWADRRHQEAAIRAHKRFSDAFAKEGSCSN